MEGEPGWRGIDANVMQRAEGQSTGGPTVIPEAGVEALEGVARRLSLNQVWGRQNWWRLLRRRQGAPSMCSRR